MDHLCPRQTFASAPCLSCLSQPQTPKRPTKLLFRNYSYPAPPNYSRFHPTTTSASTKSEARPLFQTSKSLEVVPTLQSAVKPSPLPQTTQTATTLPQVIASALPQVISSTLPQAMPTTLPQLVEDRSAVSCSQPETKIKTLLHSINVPPTALHDPRRDSATLPCFGQPIRPIPIAQ